MLFQVGILAPDHAGDHIAHAVVVAQLLMLIPGGVLPALGGPLSSLIGRCQIVGQQHTAGGAGDDLVAVKGNGPVSTKGAGLRPLVGSAQGLGGILDEDGPVLLADSADLIHLARRSVQVSHHDRLYLRVELKRLFQGHRVHVPGIPLRVDEHGYAPLVHHRVHSGSEGHIRTKHLVPRLYPRQFHTQMKGGGAGGQGDRILTTHLFTGDALHLVDVLSHGGHPVGLIGLGNISQLIPVHSGRGQPNFFLKWFHIISLSFS